MVPAAALLQPDSGPTIHARGRIRPFALTRPREIADAVSALADPAASAIAGGIDVVLGLKRGAPIRRLVWLRDVATLRKIEADADGVTIGACVQHAGIERDRRIAAAIPALPSIVAELGNVRIREVGTIGGNLMAAQRAYDWLPILAALGAQLTFATGQEVRRIDAADVTTQDGRWALPDALLTAIRISGAGAPRLAFERRFKPAISIAACVRTAGEALDARVAIGCYNAAPIVRTFSNRRTALDESRIAELVRRGLDLPTPDDDGFASASYRRHLAHVLTARLLHRLLEA
jgi:carbon-monoxide dehydrogenase medium subunit